jgi:hypothetical protein
MADDLDFGPDEVPPVLDDDDVPADEDVPQFSAEELVLAESLRKYSPYSRSLAYLALQLNLTATKVMEPIATWPFPQLVRFATYLSTIGVPNAIVKETGVPILSEVQACCKSTVAVIKASLTLPKLSNKVPFTDYTLVETLMAKRGVTLYSDDGVCRLRVPGYDGDVRVTLTGNKKARILSGGMEFVNWHNELFGTNFAYKQISDESRYVSMFILSRYTLGINAAGGRYLVERDTTAKTAWVPAPKKLMAFVSPMVRLINKGISDRTLISTIGQKSDPRSHVEWALDGVIAQMSPASLVQLRNCVLAIKEYWVEVQTSINLALAKVSPKVLNGGKYPFPNTKTICGTFASVSDFVESHRQTFRAFNDLPHKSDAPGMGVVGVAASVASKIQVAIAPLKGIHKPKCIHAFGTHIQNWWSAEIDNAFPDTQLKYFDIDSANRPPIGYFEVGDVSRLPPNSGKGMFIFDDTHPIIRAPGVKGGNVPNYTEKLYSILGANYDGGVVKMRIGCSDDASNIVGTVPPIMMKFVEKYEVVYLSSGSGFHSQEYFMTFYGNGAGLWVPPSPVDKPPKFVIDGTQAKNSELLRHYIRSWLVVRVCDLVKSNVVMSAQVIAGVVGETDWRPLTYVPPVTSLYLGGSAILGITNGEAAARAVPDDPGEIDI